MSDSGAMSDSTQSIKTNDLPNGISGNVPDAAPQQNSYGVNSPGRLIGPSPENGQPDPRFPNERGTSSGSGNEGNNKSTAAGSAPAPASTSTKNEAGSGEAANSEAANGTTTSNINEGLPSASEDNSGGNSGGASGGTGGGAGGTEVNAGGDARPDKDASTAGGGEGDMGRQTRGAAPYALGLGAIVIGTFLAVMMGARAKRNR